MPVVAVVGAGALGGNVARSLVTRGGIDEVRLVDDDADVAAGLALDIRQAAALDGSSTRISGNGDLRRAIGADAIVLADHARPDAEPEVTGDSGFALLKRIAEIDADAVVVCAGCRQQTLLERGLGELGLDRTRCFGTAPEAFRLALRALVALEADASPTAVALVVLGRVPDRVVVPWRDATVSGMPLDRVLSPPQLGRIERWAAALGAASTDQNGTGGLGPHALSAAAAQAARMLVSGSRNIVCCSVGLRGEFGQRRGVGAVPVVIGQGGIERFLAPDLDAREQVLLDNAIAG